MQLSYHHFMTMCIELRSMVFVVHTQKHAALRDVTY